MANSQSYIKRTNDKQSYRFEKVYCSQCGECFGPGDHGFSHCENHKHLSPVDEYPGSVVLYPTKAEQVK